MEVDRVNVVGVGTLEVHHVADDKRLAFLSPKGTRGHRPSNPEVFDVIDINLV